MVNPILTVFFNIVFVFMYEDWRDQIGRFDVCGTLGNKWVDMALASRLSWADSSRSLRVVRRPLST